MELPEDSVAEDSWWLEEAANATDDQGEEDGSDIDSFGEFEQAADTDHGNQANHEEIALKAV